MKVRLVGLASVCCVLTLLVSFSNSSTSRSQTTKSAASNVLPQAEQDLLNEINLARAQPNVYASYLEGMKSLFKGKEYTRPNHGTLMTQEGWSAVEEAIRFLRAAKPQGPLDASNGLSLAAQMHCMDQSASGRTGHKGGGGLIEERVKAFGIWNGGIGENLSYGDDSARERVLTWLIDDGVASRGHRKRLMSGDYKVAGLACASHPEFVKMCVLELAGGFQDSIAAKPAGNKTNSSGTKDNKPPSAKLSVATQTQSSGAANNNSNGAKSSGDANSNKSKLTTKPPTF